MSLDHAVSTKCKDNITCADIFAYNLVTLSCSPPFMGVCGFKFSAPQGQTVNHTGYIVGGPATVHILSEQPGDNQ